MSNMNTPPASTPKGITAYRKAYHLKVLSMVPNKLAIWAQRIDYKTFTESSLQEVESLVSSIQAIAHCTKEIVSIEHSSPSSQSLPEVLVSRKKWYMNLQQVFTNLSHDPGDVKTDGFRDQLTELWHAGEAKVKETLDFSSDTQLSSGEKIHLYSLLGANHNLYRTLLEYSDHSGSICWHEWRKSRF